MRESKCSTVHESPLAWHYEAVRGLSASTAVGCPHCCCGLLVKPPWAHCRACALFHGYRRQLQRVHRAWVPRCHYPVCWKQPLASAASLRCIGGGMEATEVKRSKWNDHPGTCNTTHTL